MPRRSSAQPSMHDSASSATAVLPSRASRRASEPFCSMLRNIPSRACWISQPSISACVHSTCSYAPSDAARRSAAGVPCQALSRQCRRYAVNAHEMNHWRLPQCCECCRAHTVWRGHSRTACRDSAWQACHARPRGRSADAGGPSQGTPRISMKNRSGSVSSSTTAVVIIYGDPEPLPKCFCPVMRYPLGSGRALALRLEHIAPTTGFRVIVPHHSPWSRLRAGHAVRPNGPETSASPRGREPKASTAGVHRTHQRHPGSPEARMRSRSQMGRVGAPHFPRDRRVRPGPRQVQPCRR